jgi:hypothetical protein
MNATTVEQSPTSRERAIERATRRALEQAQAGNTPVLLRQAERWGATQQTWSIGSRTTGGAVYLVEATAGSDGIETRCTCAAADAERLCWHRASIRLSIYGDITWTDGRRPVEHLASVSSRELMSQAVE